MSDKNYNYKAEIEIIQMKKTTRLNGFGSFIKNENLVGKWNLSQIKSIKFSSTDLLPFLEFDFENNLILGNTACNDFNTSFEIKNNEIKFTELFLTDFNCNDLIFEQFFIKSLIESNSFRIEGKELKFYKDGYLEIVLENK